MENSMAYESNLNLKATELRLGLPGSDDSEEQSPPTHSTVRINKRAEPDRSDDSNTGSSLTAAGGAPPPAKAQVVGWPPIRSHRKNSLQQSKKTETDVAGGLVKVSVDGAPYLRKIDLKVYGSYSLLLKALEQMFKLTIGKYSEREGYNGSDYSPTYEDKDGDWMLLGDVPWEMFLRSCKRMRIMKGSEEKS